SARGTPRRRTPGTPGQHLHGGVDGHDHHAHDHRRRVAGPGRPRNGTKATPAVRSGSLRSKLSKPPASAALGRNASSEREIDADANGTWPKRRYLVAHFKAERIAEGEAVAAHVQEVVDVHRYAQLSQINPGTDLAIEKVPLGNVER